MNYSRPFFFLSVTLILQIIIDHRCGMRSVFQVAVSLFSSSTFFFCSSSEPRPSPRQAPVGELPLFLIPGVPSVSQTSPLPFILLGGKTPLALTVSPAGMWRNSLHSSGCSGHSGCVCVCVCVCSPLSRASTESSQPNHFGNGWRAGDIGLEKGI